MAFKPKSKFKKKDDRGGRGLFKRRKFCRFTAEKIEEVDYRMWTSSRTSSPKTPRSCRRASPAPRRAYQRQLSVAIKRARFLALMPYTDLHQ